MGNIRNVGIFEFPKQGEWKGYRVAVCFHYDTSRVLNGEIVRQDIEEPFLTIIKLEDNRYILGTECQYKPLY